MKKWLRRMSLVLSILLVLGAFTGCQSPTEMTAASESEEESTTQTSTADVTPQTEDLGWMGQFTKGQITAFYNEAIRIGYTEEFKYVTKGYTVGSGDAAEEVNYFMDLVREKFPHAEFVKIENQYDTAAIIAANCDVVFGLDTYALQALKSQSGLKEYVPEWAEDVSANLNDTDNMYFAIAKDMILSVYRMTGTPEDSADVEKQKDVETFGGIEITGVETVADLWKEGSAYVGLYELDKYINDWNDLSNKTFLVGLLSNYIDKEAESTNYISQEGWDQLQAMINGRSAEWAEAETQKNVCNTGDYINNIAQTQIVIDCASNSIDKMAWYWAAGKCARLDVMEYPSVPTFVYGVAITANTTKAEASQLFVDFIGSPETVTEMAKHVRTLIPAIASVFTETNVKRTDENGSGAEYKDYTAAIDAEGNKLVRVIPTRQYMLSVINMEAQEIDWDFVCQHVDAWVEIANGMVKQ